MAGNMSILGSTAPKLCMTPDQSNIASIGEVSIVNIS